MPVKHYTCSTPPVHLPGLSTALLLLFVSLSTPASAEDWLHTVRPGDTFWSICKELTEETLCWRKLPDYNPEVQDVRHLPPGSQVKIPVEWLKAPPVPATVEFVRGQAFLERNIQSNKRAQPGSTLAEGENYLQTRSSTAERSVLKAGTRLYMGDKIITSEGSVLLRFADQSSFLIKAGSELVLERLSAHGETGMIDTHMRLNRGSGRAKVNSRDGKSRYQISTPAAIAAARGTEFSISAEPARDGNLAMLRNEVLEGRVSVSSGSGEQMVNQGFGTVAEQGKPPIKPVKLLGAPELALAEQTELPFTLNWSSVENAVAYTVDVSRHGEHLASYRVQDNSLHFADLASADYLFAVRAVDSLGLKGLEAQAETSAAVTLAIPELLTENIKVNSNSVNIEWPKLANAEAYQLQISTDPLFSNLLYDQTLSSNQATVELPGEAIYYARTQAIYPHYGAGEFSAAQSFSSEQRDIWMIILQTLGILAVIV